MGFFGFLQRPDLGQGLERFAATPNALLLDVRTQEEYAVRSIPESRNLPLQTLGGQSFCPPPGDAPLRLLSQRRQEPSGGRPAAAHGVY